MHKIPITLKNHGLLLPGAGEGRTLVDADPIVNRRGFPYVPGRTIKGLFREALIEVLEIEGKTHEEIFGPEDARPEPENLSQDFAKRVKQVGLVEALFGTEGAASGAPLRFSNLQIEGWEQARGYLRQHGKEKWFHPQRITAHYTTEIPTTAVDHDSGIADDKSLRNFAAIRPGQTFCGHLLCEQEVWDEGGIQTLLEKTLQHLRYAGMKRNRGFGRISITKNELPADAAIKASSAEQNPPESQAQPQGPFPPGPALKIRITTDAPTVLTQAADNPNTVSTAAYIAGSRIRGLLAAKMIREKQMGRNAHTHQVFQQTILENLQFLPAYPQNFRPFPAHIHYKKGETRRWDCQRIQRFPRRNHQTPQRTFPERGK